MRAHVMLPAAIQLVFLCTVVVGGGTEVRHLATFSLKVLEFQSHARRRLDGLCCKAMPGNASVQEECTSECALSFRVCLEPFSAPVSLTDSSPYSGPCLYGQTRSGHWGNTDISYGFKEAPIHAIDLELAWPRSFSIILEAYDLVSLTERHLIDRAVYRGVLRPTANARPPAKATSSEWHHVTVSTQSSGYTVSMRVACRHHHYNTTCTKVCTPSSSRYSCDSNGDKVCEPGWSGSECDKAICKVGCHPVHGSCVQPGECDCATGWQGAYCDECIKYPGCRHGTCNNAPFTCHCLLNWGGVFCDRDLDYCGRHHPCKNGGLCKNIDSLEKPFNCSCTREYTGELCEIKHAPCSWNPCKRGRCITKEGDDYECVCEPGWRGDHCDENIDYCQQNSCLNGGVCHDLDGVGFQCLCPPGYKGSNCQLRSPCADSRCVHARECTHLLHPIKGMEYACVCQPGWSGPLCDQNIDDCEGKCQNGGTCQDLLDDFYCICPVGFSGRHCEINHECFNKPCQNNGICHEIDAGYRCECPEGFTGYNCEVSTSGCNPNLCQNGAYCYTLPNGFYCKCSLDHYGQFCEFKRPYCGSSGCETILDPCQAGLRGGELWNTVPAHPESRLMAPVATYLVRETSKITLPDGVCGPYGTCVSSPGTEIGYTCVCSKGFQGKYCHEVVNFCEENPCANGGTCINSFDGYECVCGEGFTGLHCQTAINLCQPNPCHNGGYCQHTSHHGDFQCLCAPGWSGRWCQLRTESPCAASKICFNAGTCIDDRLGPGGFHCECDPPWMGSVCHLVQPHARACANKTVCKNGATCVDVGNGYNCICRPGFDGQQCENNINECSSIPCRNNGTCRDLINAFECDCPIGFIGTDCRINVNECATYPCAFGATCLDRVGDYECICPEGRRGRNCDEVDVFMAPKPPACNFHNRIYDHNETWTYNCQKCLCNAGQVLCIDDFCGYWSCLNAVGQSDRFACKPDEVCHILPSDFEGDCFVPPCYLRTVCLNTSQPIKRQLERLLPDTFPGASMPGCRPNAASQLDNRCARMTLVFDKQRLPYSVTVGDVCNALRNQHTIVSLRGTSKGSTVGLSCDVKASTTKRKVVSAIEITISAADDQLYIGSSGYEFSFVHQLIRNLSRDVVIKAATNLTRDRGESIPDSTADPTEVRPLPPMPMLLGTEKIHYYWHRVLLGVVEVRVDTMVVREQDYGSPLLVPMVCILILVATIGCVVILCVYFNHKHRNLLLRYAPPIPPNNELMGSTLIEQKAGRTIQATREVPRQIHRGVQQVYADEWRLPQMRNNTKAARDVD